jgi:hypothetical protein
MGAMPTSSSVSAPAAYVEWMNAHLGFNPRSQTNSDALSDFVVADLRRLSAKIKDDLDKCEIMAKKNPAAYTKIAGRSIDLVLSEPSPKGHDRPTKIVRVSVEHKTIMTAHGKARWNRYGDIIAYSNHMHNHRAD